MDYEGFRELVKRRRSYWHFRADRVSEGDVERIIDAARYAPSAFNSQPWEFVVIREQGFESCTRDEFLSLFREYGVIDRSIALAKKYATAASGIVESFDDCHARDALMMLPAFIIERKF